MTFKLAYICGSSSWGGLEMNQIRNAIWMQEKGYNVALLCWENSPIAVEAQKNQIQTYSVVLINSFMFLASTKWN